MEDQLRSLGILDTSNSPIDSIVFDGINLEANVLSKKMKVIVLSMEPSDAHKLLENLVRLWQSRFYLAFQKIKSFEEKKKTRKKKEKKTEEIQKARGSKLHQKNQTRP